MAIWVMGIDYGKYLKRQHEALKARLRYAQELDHAVKAGVCTPKQTAEHQHIISMRDKYGGFDSVGDQDCVALWVG